MGTVDLKHAYPPTKKKWQGLENIQNHEFIFSVVNWKDLNARNRVKSWNNLIGGVNHAYRTMTHVLRDPQLVYKEFPSSAIYSTSITADNARAAVDLSSAFSDIICNLVAA